MFLYGTTYIYILYSILEAKIESHKNDKNA